MKIQLVGSAVGPLASAQQFAMSYIVDDGVAIDAGCLGLVWPLDVQRRVEHVFLSHSHMDHVASLPLYVENVYQYGPACPTIYANDETLDSLRADLFNDRIWPDMIRLATEETPFMNLVRLESERPVTVGPLTILPVSLNHIVPTLGFLVHDGASAVAFISDTAPTERIWELANATPHLKAVFLEACFPNRMQWLAEKSAHLTTELFDAEYRKLERPLPVVVVHIKAAFREEILSELADLNLPQLSIGSPDGVYEF
ncbi:MAG TPA: 3',5'-cyclic-nucleotide phosphodiesterase [Planctomycetaceae bacterium]|nr:3',5'-cyclic-nucleotide phosphodiesterase [Planctomycetaceae bacterium]